MTLEGEKVRLAVSSSGGLVLGHPCSESQETRLCVGTWPQCGRGCCWAVPGAALAQVLPLRLSFHSQPDSEPPSHFLFSLLLAWLPSLVWLLITHLCG